ncbi:O-antigen ligase family protein [Spongisporangium articulatum]|uniref:O-antigen ligase family protein n=1 Tax=Spongisporangium articulatum TaxID=3362603 RepID=A0ABW8AT65_9ACTN
MSVLDGAHLGRRPTDVHDHEVLHDHGDQGGRAALFVVGTYPLLWVIGLGGLFWPLLMGALLFRRTSAPRTPESTALILVSQLLVASVPLGLVAFGFNVGRVVALAANVTVWVATAALLRRATADGAFREHLLRLFLLIGAVQGAVVALAYTVYPGSLGLPLLHGLSAKMPSGMASFASDLLVYPSWLDGFAIRSSGMMGNPTWAGATGAAALLIALTYRSTQAGDNALRLAAVAGGAVAVHFALSRSVEFALMGSLALALGEVARRRLKLGFTPIVVGLMALPMAAYIWGPRVVEWATHVNDERVGSAESRGAIYTLTWHYIQQLPFPLLGYGIKPQSNGLVASVASHSTYLGLTFRAGVLAVVLVLAVAVMLARRAAADGNVIGVAVVVFVAVWCIFEDFDGGHLLPLVLVVATTPQHLRARREAAA